MNLRMTAPFLHSASALSLVWRGRELVKMKAILTEYAPQPAEINAAYPSARHVSAKVRAFSEFLRAEFQENPHPAYPLAAGRTR